MSLRRTTRKLLLKTLEDVDSETRAEFERRVVHTGSTGSTLLDKRAVPGDQSLKGVNASYRREFIAIAAAAAFGAPLDQPMSVIVEAADRSRVPRTVRTGDIQQLRDTTEALAVWDRQSGGGATRHMLLGELRWGLAMLEGSCTPNVRTQLAACVAELADAAAWATFDAGITLQARALFTLGLRLAAESGDLGMRAHVATGFARQEIFFGNTVEALDLVRLVLQPHLVM